MSSDQSRETPIPLKTGRFVAWSDTALSDRRDLALLAVEKTRMPMMVSDPRQPDNPIVLANQAFLNLTGYSADEIIGRNCRFLQGPETSAAAIQQIRDDLVAGRDTNVEMLNYRKDGSTFWNALHINPLRNDDGDIVYYFASQQDVSRQHEATALEAAEHAMMREVDHRAKNALALVQGIVRLSRADNAQDYADAVQGRVDALALAHALLADAHWRPVPLEVLVTSLIRTMQLGKVNIDGPRVDLQPGQVQPLSLVLHEVLCNARQHGALSVSDGRAELDWQANDGRLRIVLRESGGPAPAEQRKPGFGMTVVNAVTARQLGGEVAFDWRTEGLVSTLTVPNRVD